MDNPKHEPRNEARRRALKGARIVFKGHGATIYCTVRNLLDRGACLNVERYVGIPDIFDLVLPQRARPRLPRDLAQSYAARC